MKVLYLGNGLPHYFNPVLSAINRTPGVELVAIVPKTKSRFIGDGVYQTREDADFRIIELQEYVVGRPFASFKGLPALLCREKPDVVVIPEHLLLAFDLHPMLWILRRILKFGLVLKSIPFTVPSYSEARHEISGSAQDRSMNQMPAQEMRSTWPRRLRRRCTLFLRRRRYQRLDAHVNYIDAGREIYQSYGVSPDKIFVTRNSPDTDRMLRVETDLSTMGRIPQRSSTRVLHVGRLVSQKRVDLLLAAFREVVAEFPQAELLVVGDGPEAESFRDLTKNLGIAKNVTFAGPVYDPHELAMHFLSSSIFVLPGLGGLSINEAMFYGLAVICAGGDGTERFLVREGLNGTFFREGNMRSLTQAMLALLSDQKELVAMGRRSREIIDREVNIQTVVQEYVRAFRHASRTE
ncbi:MAG: glycosyltransferase family 4 protein [Nitrospira sp.]|nr:glycosyltransferase family 4 protein [Nitrospira sp.]